MVYPADRPRLRWLSLGALALVTLALLWANVWIARHRMHGYNFRFANYATAYVPAEQPVIEGFEAVRPGSMAIRLSVAPDEAWQLAAPESVSATREGDRVQLSGPTDSHTYRVLGLGAGRTRTVRIKMSGEPLVTTSDLVIGEVDQLPLSEHALEASDFPPEQVEVIRAELAGAGLSDGDDTWQRMDKVWHTLYPQLHAQRGNPPPWLNKATPFVQFQTVVKEKKAKAYCTNFAAIYGLFGAVAGLPIRVVDVNREAPGGVALTAHTFTEVFVPEVGGWVYSDMNLNLQSVRDRVTGRYMNGVQLAHLHEAGALGSLVARMYIDGQWVDRPYVEVMQFVTGFLNANATFVFHRHYDQRGSLWAWLDRYLFNPELAYGLYRDNRLHHTKLAVFGATVAVGLLWMALVAALLRRRFGG